MSGINKAIIVGHLGADPEIRRTAAGDPVASFRVATSETWRDKSTGERREKTEWHSVVIFNDQIANIVEAHLRKGSKVYVEGQMVTRKWTDRGGIERYTTEIVLQKFRGELQLLDKREGVPAATDPSDYGTTRSRAQGGAGGLPAGSDDEIPFAPEWR